MVRSDQSKPAKRTTSPRPAGYRTAPTTDGPGRTEPAICRAPHAPLRRHVVACACRRIACACQATSKRSWCAVMNERSRLVALLVLSAAVAGLLTWAIVGPRQKGCTNVVLGQRLTKEQAQNLGRAFSDSVETCGSFLSGAA